MPVNLITTTPPGLHYNTVGSSTFTSVSIPAGVSALSRRPDKIEYQKKHIFVGKFSVPLTFIEANNSLVTTGQTEPSAGPTLAAASGGTLSGNHIGYYAPLHQIGGVDIHEGNLSPGSSTLALDGTQRRQWTLPATAPDTRTTHWRLYASVDGAAPAFAADVAIGTTTYTEGTATGSLGAPPPLDTDGNVLNRRGKPPYTRFIVKLNNRAWYLGDPDHPERAWYSEIDDPESVGAESWLPLKDGETITAGAHASDELLIMGAQCAYLLRGFDESDFVLFKISSTVGCLTHFGIKYAGEMPVIPSARGLMGYPGGGEFRALLKGTMAKAWRAAYKADPDVFQDGIAVYNKNTCEYQFVLSYEDQPCDRRWVLNFEEVDPSEGGTEARPETYFFYRNRAPQTVGLMYNDTTMRDETYTGSCDGYIRREDVAEDDDDDGDTYNKALTLELPHFFPKHQAGFDDEAFKVTDATFFVQSETKSWTLEGRAGDDSAYLGAAQWTPPAVEASALTVSGRTAAPKTSHPFRNIGMSGKGFTFKVTQSKPIGFEFRGLAFRYEPSDIHSRSFEA